MTLDIASESFIRPPRDSQRNWLVNRAMKEFSDDLVWLDRMSSEFIAGSPEANLEDRTHRQLEDDEIMEDWQIPLMKAMSDIVAGAGKDILEIGFGRGVSASFIQEHGVASHTIVECNEHVVQRFNKWVEQQHGKDIRLMHGKWQDVIEQLESYDGIFFHAYPLHADEFYEHVVQTSTFAEPFFEVAASHLRPGGTFTYLSNEYDSLSRGHQRGLFEHFQQVNLSRLQIDIPHDSKDSLWGKSLVLVEAIR